MEQTDNQTLLRQLINRLEQAQHQEALAREREQKGFDPASVMRCGFDWGGIDCYHCETLPECDQWLREYEDETKALFTAAWQGYQDVLTQLRKLVAEWDDPIVWALLAEVLMNIDVHPNRMETDPADLYWEAQYWYLRLFFEAGDKEAFERAKNCEAFRHATVRLIEE